MKNKDYKLEKEIGKGAFGIVYEGTNVKTGEKIAIKKINKNKVQLANKPEYLIKAIKQEVENMKKCQCENSVKFFDYFEDDHNYVIIMELCDSSLLNMIKKSECFSIEEVYNIFSSLNKVFKIMHKNNIVHRDLKLENILIKFLDKEKTKFVPKLADFGFSKEIEEESKNTFCGSYYTMAPEVKNREKYGPKADLWSLGVIIYYCYMKKLPYDCKNLQNIVKTKELKYERPKDLFLANLIDRLLVVNPNERMSWEEYFNHAFFKLSSLNEYNIGFKNNNLKYYKAKYKENENEYKTVLIKVMKQNNLEQDFYYKDFEIHKLLSKDKNALEIISTQELKDENENQIIYIIYEANEECIPLNEYCKNHNFEEKDIKKFIKLFFDIFKKYSNKDIFISLYSFIVFPDNEIKLIDFGLHKKFLSNEDIKIYYAPNESEITKSDCPSKTLLMNFGITILKIINNNEDEIFYKNNKFDLKYKKQVSEKLNSFLSKCLCIDIKNRADWNNLENEEFLTENLDNKAEILLNEKQNEILLNQLLKKYEIINSYYSIINIEKLDYINENEDFIFLTLYEIDEIKKILSNENEFNKNMHEISFLTLLMEKDSNIILENRFFNLNSKDCYNISLINNSLFKDKKDNFIDKITKIYDNLIKIILNIKKRTNSNKYDFIFNKINDNFLENFIKGFGQSNFYQFFFSFIQKFNENRTNKNFDHKNADTELNLFKYIAEFLLFFKEGIKDNNYLLIKKGKEEILNEINDIFLEDKNKDKFVLISILCGKIKNIFTKIDDLENILKEDNEEALEKLIKFYPFILQLINYNESNYIIN